MKSINWADIGKTLLKVFATGGGAYVAGSSTSTTTTVVSLVLAIASAVWSVIGASKSSSTDTSTSV
jgi:hypothetical protein